MGRIRKIIGSFIYHFFPDLKTKLFWINRGKEYYNERISPSYKKLYDDLAERVISLNPHNVLEYGCGYGYLLKNIAEKSNNGITNDFHGFDFSKTQIVHARNYFPEGKFIKANITERISIYRDDEFDIAIGVGVLMYIKKKNIKAAIRELIRVSNRYIFIVEYVFKYLSENDRIRYRNAQPADGREIYDYEELLRDAGIHTITVVRFDTYFDKAKTDEMPHTLIIGSKENEQ